jgi:UDP-2-acetamido-3-amino-2,3-dideoxy-glucuronate N-acetyltransferase
MSKYDGLRIGVIGAGYWGPNLIRNCAEFGVLDSVCDLDELALQSVRATYPSVFTTDSTQTLLDRPVDGVIIAAPAQLHAKLALEAIAAHKHVFVEKPLALTVADGIRVEEAAKSANQLVFVGHLVLYHPAVKRLRSLVAEGILGHIWHVRSRRLSLGKLRTCENVWWSFAPHDVALMLAIFGEEPQRCTAAQAGRTPGVLSDVAYADFLFSRDRIGHIEVCWLDPDKSSRLDVFGTSGVLTLQDSRDGSSLRLRQFHINANSDTKATVERGNEQRISFEQQEPLRIELEAFFDAVLTGKRPETDASQGIRVLKALALAADFAGAGLSQEVEA